MRRLAALLLAVAVPTAAQEAPEPKPDLKPALSAAVGFALLDGRDGPIPPGEPFAIEIRLRDHAAAEPPAGLALYGWLRRQDPGNIPCAEAAEAFLRTGRLPVDAVFLNDPLVAVVTEDDTLLLIDPEFSLASANILAAARLPGRPAALVPDTEARRLLLPLPAERRLLAIDASGALREIGAGLGRPEAAAPAPGGGAYVLDAETARVVRLPAGPAPDLPAAGLTSSGAAAAIWGPEGAVLFDAGDGGVLISAPAPAAAAVALADAEGRPVGLAIAGGRELRVLFLDAPAGEPMRIGLAAPATRLAMAPGGRFLFAYDPASGPVSIVDVARGRLVQATSAVGGAIAEVLATERAAYLMLADQSRVGALDLAALARGEPAEFREVPLGSPLDRPLGDGGLMTRLAPDPGVLAVHRGEAQGYRLNDYAAMGNAPASTAMPIRGGMPRLVATIDRSFAEGPRGTFRTVAVLPGPGHWELVATTGLGALSFCLPAPVADPGAPEPDLGRLVAVSVDEAGSLRLKVLDGAGAPATIAGTLMFAELTGAWRDSVPFRTGADGVSTDIYELPADADVAVTLQTPDGRPFHPLILETDP